MSRPCAFLLCLTRPNGTFRECSLAIAEPCFAMDGWRRSGTTDLLCSVPIWLAIDLQRLGSKIVLLLFIPVEPNAHHVAARRPRFRHRHKWAARLQLNYIAFIERHRTHHKCKSAGREHAHRIDDILNLILCCLGETAIHLPTNFCTQAEFQPKTNSGTKTQLY